MAQIASQLGTAVNQAMNLMSETGVLTPLGGSAVTGLQIRRADPESAGDMDRNIILSSQDQMFLIEPFNISSSNYVPLVGDTIVLADGTYEVQKPDGSQSWWWWADQFHLRMCVFTRRTA